MTVLIKRVAIKSASNSLHSLQNSNITLSISSPATGLIRQADKIAIVWAKKLNFFSLFVRLSLASFLPNLLLSIASSSVLGFPRLVL